MCSLRQPPGAVIADRHQHRAKRRKRHRPATAHRARSRGHQQRTRKPEPDRERARSPGITSGAITAPVGAHGAEYHHRHAEEEEPRQLAIRLMCCGDRQAQDCSMAEEQRHHRPIDQRHQHDQRAPVITTIDADHAPFGDFADPVPFRAHRYSAPPFPTLRCRSRSAGIWMYVHNCSVTP